MTRLLLMAASLFVVFANLGMAGFAFARSGRVQQGDEAVPMVIGSSNVPIEVDAQPDTDVEITNVTLRATSNTFNGASFTIKNLSDKALVAYSLALNLYFDTDPEHPMQMRVTEDGWFLNQYVLKPGDSKEGLIRSTLTSKTAVKLLRVTVSPEYVEFAGGQAAGPNVRAVGKSLAISRNAKAEVLNAYSAKLRSGESLDSVMSSLKSDVQGLAKGQTGTRIGMNELMTVMRLEGPQGFLKRCTEPAAPRAY